MKNHEKVADEWIQSTEKPPRSFNIVNETRTIVNPFKIHLVPVKMYKRVLNMHESVRNRV